MNRSYQTHVRACVTRERKEWERQRERECVLVCVCVRERERGREGERDRERVCACEGKREREKGGPFSAIPFLFSRWKWPRPNRRPRGVCVCDVGEKRVRKRFSLFERKIFKLQMLFLLPRLPLVQHFTSVWEEEASLFLAQSLVLAEA